jgi:hemerythrin superfamily protein
MLSELETGPTAGPGTGPDQLAQRKKLAQRLVIEESKHEAVEEMYFWPVVREKLTNGDNLADQATAQEQQGKEILDKLDRLDAHDPEFERLMSQFIVAGREHIAYEEDQVWPGLRQVLSEKDASDLGTLVEQGKKIAPTRPHPKIPASPEALVAAGLFAAATDKMRDVAAGRGKR